jgi:hypothetical protein
MIRMHMMKHWILLAALAASSVSCGDVVRQGKSPVYLVISALGASRGGASSTEFGGTLHSDVLTNVITPAPCSPDSPCPTIFPDLGQVVLRISPKDIGGVTPAQPSLNNEVTVNRYRIVYRRADGRNTPGVDVPYPFDGAATGTVPAIGTLTMTFEIVRHVAKMEAPLRQLAVNATIITTIADVTFYGRDQVGNEVSTTGSILIDFGNFGDER